VHGEPLPDRRALVADLETEVPEEAAFRVAARPQPSGPLLEIGPEPIAGRDVGIAQDGSQIGEAPLEVSVYDFGAERFLAGEVVVERALGKPGLLESRGVV